LAHAKWHSSGDCGDHSPGLASEEGQVMDELLDRFTIRAAGDGWDVIDLGRKDRVVAHCADRTEAQAIAWFFRGDYETGTRLQLEALEWIDDR
jgi:hypothetical protein